MTDHPDQQEAILNQFRALSAQLEQAKNDLRTTVEQGLYSANLRLSMVTARVKTEDSLRRKLNRKGKYLTLTDVTDLIGIRVITYSSDDAGIVGRVVRELLECDWENCEDKLDRLRAEQFGYRSDHYVVFVPGYGMSGLEGLRAELQVRTVLQHAWAEIEHDDLGYHSDTLVPAEIRRRLARAAAVLEGVDAEFSEIRRIARKVGLPCIRVEGLTEPLGEIEISIDTASLRTNGDESDLVLYFNVVITPTLGEEKEPLLIVEDAAVSKPVRGDLIGANSVRFRGAFRKYMIDGLKYVRCRLRGIRVNANMLGLSTSPSSETKVWAAVSPNAGATHFNPQLLTQIPVATILPGLITRCLLNAKESTGEFAAIDCEFTEGFPGAFRDAVEETAGDRLAKYGTRLRAEFAQVPDDSDVWVTVQNIAPNNRTQATKLVSLIETDVLGSGPGPKIEPTSGVLQTD
jgi:ppGpp synthetase/RelA/SpoT-type nucleotidyltranferase